MKLAERSAKAKIAHTVKAGGAKMLNKGSMEGWHGDEMECKGSCRAGACEDCDDLKESKADDEYAQWKCYH